MLITPRSCFIHVPKTGGIWIKKALKLSGIPCHEFSVNRNPHIGIHQCPASEKFKFAFVRHPVNFYRSYWQYKMTNGWDKANKIDMDCQSEDFHQFVKNVLQIYPGAMSKGVVDLIGNDASQIEFVGKFENLADDLITALNKAQEIFDKEAIEKLPPQNVSNKKSFPAQLTPELEHDIKKAESYVMNRFGYY